MSSLLDKANKFSQDLEKMAMILDQKIVDRINQLIQLAGSPNENEARAAAFFACKLIREHKIVIRAKTPPPIPSATPTYESSQKQPNPTNTAPRGTGSARVGEDEPWHPCWNPDGYKGKPKK